MTPVHVNKNIKMITNHHDIIVSQITELTYQQTKNDSCPLGAFINYDDRILRNFDHLPLR